MNFRLGFLLFILSFSLITSCTKENIDVSSTEEEENTPESVVCNLAITIDNTASGALLTTVTGGTAPFVYEWSTGETTADIRVTTSGDYRVTVTDSEGCTATYAIGVSISSNLCDSLEVTIDQSATGTNLLAIVTGGTPPYAYTWSTGETTAGISVATSGNYDVLVTDANGCIVRNVITVTVAGNPCDSFEVTIEQDVMGTTLMATASGGTPPYAYSWSNGETGQIIRVNANGDYEVTVTDANGCVITQTIVIGTGNPCNSLAIAVTNNPASNMLNVTVTGGTPPYNYSWSTGEVTNNITVTTSGEYTITVVDAMGCTVTESITITVGGDPCNTLTFTFELSPNAPTLTAVVSGGTAPYAYEWSTGESTAAITVMSGNTYALRIIDANGCTVGDSFDVP